MKKIINGKLYNTETAEVICSDGSHGLMKNDFNYWEDTIYKKKTGEYFMLSEGFLHWNGYEYSFVPMSLNEVKEWAIHHLDADEYMSLFGEVEE